MLRLLIIVILFPFLYSCNNPVEAREYPRTNELAYNRVLTTEVQHTKHVREQQKDICSRLRKIQRKLEKRKKNKKG